MSNISRVAVVVVASSAVVTITQLALTTALLPPLRNHHSIWKKSWPFECAIVSLSAPLVSWRRYARLYARVFARAQKLTSSRWRDIDRAAFPSPSPALFLASSKLKRESQANELFMGDSWRKRTWLYPAIFNESQRGS